MRKYLAELIATFTLVFVGVGAIISDEFQAAIRVVDSFGPLGVALAHGLALGLAIAAVGRISGGHVNPAISIAAWVSRRLSGKDLVGYVVAQVAGATLGAGLLKLIVPTDVFEFVGPGLPALNGIEVVPGIAWEAVLTFFLALVIWGTAVDPKGPKNLAPLAIGLTLTFAILAGGTFTGGALNPARWLGPAIIAWSFDNAIVWIVGPIVGALLASLLYEVAFIRADVEGEEMDSTELKPPEPSMQMPAQTPPPKPSWESRDREPAPAVPPPPPRMPPPPPPPQG